VYQWVEQDSEGGYVWEYLEGYSVKSDLTRSDASELMTSVTALGQEYSAISDAEFRQLRETAKVQDQNVTGLSLAASGYPSEQLLLVLSRKRPAQLHNEAVADT
jgi:hypothetical protein